MVVYQRKAGQPKTLTRGKSWRINADTGYPKNFKPLYREMRVIEQNMLADPVRKAKLKRLLTQVEGASADLGRNSGLPWKQTRSAPARAEVKLAKLASAGSRRSFKRLLEKARSDPEEFKQELRRMLKHTKSLPTASR